MEHPPIQLPYLDLEHFPAARMVDQETPSNPYGSRQADLRERDRQLRRSKAAHPCQPEDRQLGEHPPLEAVDLPYQE